MKIMKKSPGTAHFFKKRLASIWWWRDQDETGLTFLINLTQKSLRANFLLGHHKIQEIYLGPWKVLVKIFYTLYVN